MVTPDKDLKQDPRSVFPVNLLNEVQEYCEYCRIEKYYQCISPVECENEPERFVQTAELPALHQTVLQVGDETDQHKKNQKEQAFRYHDKSKWFFSQQGPWVENIKQWVHDPAQEPDGNGKDNAICIVNARELAPIAMTKKSYDDEKNA